MIIGVLAASLTWTEVIFATCDNKISYFKWKNIVGGTVISQIYIIFIFYIKFNEGTIVIW